jgi:hypothetical protein
MKAHHQALKDYAPPFDAYLVTIEARLVAVESHPGFSEVKTAVTLGIFLSSSWSLQAHPGAMDVYHAAMKKFTPPRGKARGMFTLKLWKLYPGAMGANPGSMEVTLIHGSHPGSMKVTLYP